MLLTRFRVRDSKYLSIRFIFELQNLRGHPDGFSWLVKNRAYFGSAHNTQLLEVFFARTELLALAVVHSPVLVGQKRDRDKTRLVLCSCAEFLLSAGPSSLKSNRSPHLLSGNWFLMDYAGNDACFPEAFYKCSNNLFAWSEMMENGLFCGGVRRKWSMAALMYFAIRAIFPPRRRVKTLQTNIQFFLWHFLYRFRNLAPPGLASHSVKVNIDFVT